MDEAAYLRKQEEDEARYDCGIVCACFGLSCGGDGSVFFGIRFL